MRRFIRYSAAATMAAATLAVMPALQARDGRTGLFMVGSGMSPINMTGMMDMMGRTGGMMGGQMGGMMDQCRQMMQGRGGGSSKPNDQWRDGKPPSGQPDKKQ